ncbi:MAG: TRAP transporter fused permease subunit [Propionibacteriales bacterium]|nr:TRAP transporter fused permease subunit [Propionibacteriales bacterium]
MPRGTSRNKGSCSKLADSTPAVDQQTARKYDPESRYRRELGWWRLAVAPLAIALTLFQLYTALFGTYTSLIQGAIHVGAAMGLIFLLYPARRGWSERPGMAWYDVVLAGAALWTNLYIVLNYERLITEAVIFGFTTLDYVVATLAILLILEGTRRCVGLPIVVLATAALAYGVFGPYMPIFPHAGFSWQRFSTETFFSSTSIFGTPIQVSSTFIYLFLFFGVLLIKTNIGRFFDNLAYAATGRFTGGTAKACVLSSGLQGTVSGSSVANTVSSGAFTIPMMKRAGFPPASAAAAEASSSTGGQLVPPVMGAAVFLMAEYTGIPYYEIIVLAIIPAALFYVGLFFGVHFEARRHGILGLPRSQLPAFGPLLRRLDLLLPLAVIVVLLFNGRSPANAALWGVLAAFLISLLRRDTRLSLSGTIKLLEDGARAALPVIAACASAGIVAGTVTKTGLGGKLAGGLLDLAQGNFLLILMLTMLACLILGMGLPTTANYVVTATVAAPVLVQFDMPLVAAHLFVFYFGILADITPPVCLAAYAGAGIAGSNPMRTGVDSVRLAAGGFIVPFVFAIEPAILLQDATFGTLVPLLATVLLGMMAISAGLAGHLLQDLNGFQRAALIAGGVVLVYPNLLVSLVGLAALVVIAFTQRLKRRR